MKFSQALPDDCPLSRAIPCNAKVYMLCKKEVISKQDCLTQAERGRAANVSGELLCTRHGLSVFSSLKSCIHQQKLFPHLGNHIAHADLREQHGVIADTPAKLNPRHMTWWAYEEVERDNCFTVMQLEK